MIVWGASWRVGGGVAGSFVVAVGVRHIARDGSGLTVGEVLGLIRCWM